MKEDKIRTILSTTVVVVLSLIGAGVWYNNTHYNTDTQSNFMRACETNTSAATCGCMYGVLQSDYTYSEAKAMDANPHGAAAQGFYSDAIGQCE